MNRLTPKQAGFCSVCHLAILTVEQKWTDGERKGTPRLFGGFLAGAKRSTVVLLDGSTSGFSLCAACNLTSENMTFVWKRVLMATRLEASPEWRKAREMKPYTAAEREAMLKNLARFMRNVPIGVICTQTYAEMSDG
jgi:NaMN:DMB phosphoribosyltransferase